MSLTSVPSPVPAADRPLSTAEVSELTGVPVATLRNWRHAGTGPRSWKLGHHLRYDRADVDAWLDAQRAATMRGDDLPAA